MGLIAWGCGADVDVRAEAVQLAPESNVLRQDVSDATVVHVQGVSCAALVFGGGVAVAPDLIITNAHVLAGMTSPKVRLPGGELVPAEVVGFDANRDLGLLRVEQVGLVPAPLVRAEIATVGLLVSIDPEGERSERPFEVIRRISATGDNIYRADGASRQVLELQMHVNPGESGSGVFDEYANLLGVVFAGSQREDGRSYALAAAEIQSFLDESAQNPTPVGPCLQLPPPEPDE